jgi:hypothetical protein
MIYLIIKEVTFENLESSFYVQDQTDDIDIAEDKLRGYRLINTSPRTSYTIVKYQKPFVLTKEMRVA